MSLQPDQLLRERYRIVRIIKSGGMGSVYEAVDTTLADSPCAVKEIHEAALASRESGYIQGRFYEEMKALVALDYPSIPKVRDYLTEGDTIYIVMELVQGRSLQEEIEQRMEMKQPPAVDYLALDMIRLLDTLTYLHGQEPPVIHRDIKPANILRDSRTGQIKLVDFGLARASGGTATQTVVGTMGYCAPEQLMGKSEPRSDIYSVGVTLCHLLTGVTPEMELFEARKPELPGIRPGLREIIEKATHPKPADRYASAQEMSGALQNWLHRPTQQVVVPVAAAAAPVAAGSSASAGLLSTPKGMAMAGALVLTALMLGYAVGHQPAKTPSQALVPKATPAPKKQQVAAKVKPAKAKPAPAVVQAPPAPVYANAPAARPSYSAPPRPRPQTAPRPAVQVHSSVSRPVQIQASLPNYSPPAYNPQPVRRHGNGHGHGHGGRRQAAPQPQYYNPPAPAYQPPAPQVRVSVPGLPGGGQLQVNFP